MLAAFSHVGGWRKKKCRPTSELWKKAMMKSLTYLDSIRLHTIITGVERAISLRETCLKVGGGGGERERKRGGKGRKSEGPATSLRRVAKLCREEKENVVLRHWLPLCRGGRGYKGGDFIAFYSALMKPVEPRPPSEAGWSELSVSRENTYHLLTRLTAFLCQAPGPAGKFSSLKSIPLCSLHWYKTA